MRSVCLLLLLLSPVVSGFSQTATPASRYTHAQGACDVSGGSPAVSFLGDSLGEYVHNPLYGDARGWPAFLPGEVVGELQNLAVGGWTTADLYAYLLRCGGEENFRLAPRVVLEIGTNDLLANAMTAVFFPWKIPEIQERVLENRRSLLRLIRTMHGAAYGVILEEMDV